MIKKQKLKAPTNGAELLLETLIEQGVDKIFGYPGGAVLPLYDALYDANIEHVLARHEQGAVHMAEGYAKATGKPGIVIATSGPGATNVVTGIADAMSDSVPLIVITGQVASPGIGKDAFQEADLVGITMPITKNNYQIRHVTEIPKVVKEAFHIATTGRKGPVVIDLPKDVTVAETSEVFCDEINLPSYQPNLMPNDLQIDRLLEELSKAKKPLIIAGAGIILADATETVRKFAETYEIPVVSTLLGLGIMQTKNPLFLGMGGMHGSFAANMALSDTDLLINIGSRLSDRLASNPNEFATNATICHIDIDPVEIGKVVETHIPIVADVQQTMLKILAKPIKKGEHTDWLKITQLHKKRHPFKYDKEAETIKPQKVIEFIGELTKGDALVVTDVGQHQMWTAQFYPFNRPKQIITSGGLGTMGYGIPAAIGAKIACPNQEVVLFVGDGGFQMTSQELAMMNEYGVKLKMILLNNGSLGMVRQWQETFFNERRSQSVFQTQPDFIMLAKAYGIDGIRITDANSVEEKLTEAFADPNCQLIEVLVDQQEHVLPMVPPGKANYQMLGVD